MDPSWRFRPPPPHLFALPHYPHPSPHLPFSPSLFHSPHLAPPMPMPSHPQPPFPDTSPEREGLLHKRMRLDDGPSAAAFSFEDERRLSLIRDHGRQQLFAHRFPPGERWLGPLVPDPESFPWNTRPDVGLQTIRGARDGWQQGGPVLDPGFGMQRFEKIGPEWGDRFARPEFDQDLGRHVSTVRMPSGYGDWVKDNYRDYVGRHWSDEGGAIKDSLYQSSLGNVNGHVDQCQLESNGIASLPCERSRFEEDRTPEPSLQNRAMSSQEFSISHRDCLPNPASDCSSPQYKYVKGSFGLQIDVPPERFSSPNSHLRAPLPMPLGHHLPVPSPSKAFSAPQHPSLQPRLIPSPPQEPPAPRPSAPIFPIGPSVVLPLRTDAMADLPAPSDAAINAHPRLQSFPTTVAVSCFPTDTSSVMLSTHTVQTARNEYRTEDRLFPAKPHIVEKPVIVNASSIFRKPHRANRPDHFVIILRGLPGSGKSYMAKLLRDLEVEEGGSVPRIHSMDDYFMTEIEKTEDDDGQRSSGSVRSKKSATKTVMEYCYEPEMEEAYRASMLKAFKRTLDDGTFNFVIVDDRNLRVADFAQFWAIGKRSGYEVYLLEATYKDPAGCAARNVHGFTSDDIQKMAEKWEEAPLLYMQIDTQSLFHMDDLDGYGIQEVEMEEEVTCDEKDVPKMHEASHTNMEGNIPAGNYSPEARRIWDLEEDSVKDLERSKWSRDLDYDDAGMHGSKEQLGALSGLVQTYGKPSKTVSWGDQGDRRGFSIGASKSTGNSLIIGPGSGYNLGSNPLVVEETCTDSSGKIANESKKHTLFLEHQRAERESFKVVFDRRRQRIGISDADEE